MILWLFIYLIVVLFWFWTVKWGGAEFLKITPEEAEKNKYYYMRFSAPFRAEFAADEVKIFATGLLVIATIWLVIALVKII